MKEKRNIAFSKAACRVANKIPVAHGVFGRFWRKLLRNPIFQSGAMTRKAGWKSISSL